MLTVDADVVWVDDGDEVRLYDARLGEFRTLNSTAAEIWRRLAGGGSADRIAADLAARFCDGDPAQTTSIEHDVHDFVADLLAAGLMSEGAGVGGTGGVTGAQPSSA